MSGTSKPEDPGLEDPNVPGPLPELDPVPGDDTPTDPDEPSLDEVPYVPPPGTQ